MRKPNIEKILLKGSPKQRMSLVCEFRASTGYGRPSPITEKEYDILFDSFKSDYEIKLFNKMAAQERAIKYYLPNILTMYNMYMNKVINLRGLCLLWMDYNREEEVFNQLLQTAKDETTKEQMRQIIKGRSLLWADVKTDKEGFIEIITDKKQKKKVYSKTDYKPIGEEEIEGTNLQEFINILSDEAKNLLNLVKTMIEVVRAFMERTGNEIKTFKDMLNELEAPLFNDYSPLPIFRKDFMRDSIPDTNYKGEPINKDVKDYSFYSKYWVFPEYSEAQIDEEYFTQEYEGYFKIDE